MKRGLESCLTLSILCCWSGIVEAETIYFKNGKMVEAKITSRDQHSVTVDWYGTPVTYWLDDIERIDELSASVQTPRIAPSPPKLPQPVAVRESSGPAQKDERLALVERVLELSGNSKEQLKQKLPERKEWFRGFLIHSKLFATLSPESREKLHQVLIEHLSVENLYDPLYETFLKEFDRQKFEAVQEWYLSPLAQKIHKTEQQALHDRDGLRQAALELRQHPPSPSRTALIKHLIQVETIGQEELVQEISPDPNWLEAIALSLYHSISDEELERCLQFWESAVGRWYLGLLKEANDHQVAQGMASLRAAVDAIVSDEEHKSRQNPTEALQSQNAAPPEQPTTSKPSDN